MRSVLVVTKLSIVCDQLTHSRFDMTRLGGRRGTKSGVTVPHRDPERALR